MSKCVRCGNCCRVAPCAYSDLDASFGVCQHLKIAIEADEFTLYRCALYNEGRISPEVASELKIGVGCEVEFNEDRRRIAYSSCQQVNWSAL